MIRIVVGPGGSLPEGVFVIGLEVSCKQDEFAKPTNAVVREARKCEGVLLHPEPSECLSHRG